METSIENDQILTLNEAAKLLRRHRSTVLTYVKSGALKAMRHPENKRILAIRLSQLNKFISYLESIEED